MSRTDGKQTPHDESHEGLLALWLYTLDLDDALDQADLVVIATPTLVAAQMLERIEQLEPSQRADRSSREAQPLYPWPLAAALLLSALWSSRPMRRRLHA